MSSIALYAATMTMMMGLAAVSVDAGYLYSERLRLINALDAAALAGISRLPEDSYAAVRTGQDLLEANGFSGGDAQFSVSVDQKEITVTSQASRDLFFARALGVRQAPVRASATARVEWITAVEGVAPFGVPQQSFQIGPDYTLKAGGGNGRKGNFHALALGGGGSAIYKQNIIQGFSGKIRIGDWLKTETGNMDGPTETGVAERVGNSPPAVDSDGNGYLDLHPDSTRVLLIPIIDYFDANGRSDVRVVGFGAFYVKDWGVSGNGEVRGQFIRYITQGESGGTENFGLRTIRLIR